MKIESILASFLGQTVLGPTHYLKASRFNGTNAEADTALGNAPGTTRYSPCQPAAVLVQGVLPDDQAVQDLQAMAWQSGPLLVPTHIANGGWDCWLGAWFPPTSLTFGEPTSSGTPFTVIYTCCGQLQDSGCMGDRPNKGILRPSPDGPANPTGYEPQPAFNWIEEYHD